MEGVVLGTIHMIVEQGERPVYAIGSFGALKDYAKAGTLRGVMLVKAEANTDLSTRKVIDLQEILDVLPPEMVQYGTIAGIQLEGEQKPTTIVIYSNDHIEAMRQLTYARVWISDKRSEEVLEHLKKLRDEPQLLDEMLVDPIPVVKLQGLLQDR